MRRVLLLLAVAAIVAACGSDDPSTAPCDLLSPSAARAVAGDGLEAMDLADALPVPDAADRACIYAPPGTRAGDEPAQVAALQVDTGLYASAEELLTQGEALEGLGHPAIIETESGGLTVVALVDVEEQRSFGLVVRGEAVDRSAVVDLAREIAEKLT